MESRRLIELKIKELRIFVKELVNADSTKEFKRWLKNNWEFFKPYIQRFKFWSKTGLPSLRFKEIWQNLAIAIQKILKEQALELKVKVWKKMDKLSLKVEYLRKLQIVPSDLNKYTKADFISSLKNHYTDYEEDLAA